MASKDNKDKEYKYWVKFDNKNKTFTKEDLTAGTLVTDLRNCRYSRFSFLGNWNIQQVPNVLVIHRNCIIHKGLSVTNDFQKDPEAYKNRLAGIVYDYVTTVFYLREYIDAVWNDQKADPGKYSSGQNERTFKKFVSPAHESIEVIVKQMRECEKCAKALTEKEKEDCEADLQDVSKHYALIVDFDSVIGKEVPEEIKKLVPTILSDPGSMKNLMDEIGEPLLNRMKAVIAENNDKLKEELTIAFKKFLDENHAKLEQQYVKLNAEVIEMEKSMNQVQSDISNLKEGQQNTMHKIDETNKIIDETKEEIERRLTDEFNRIYDSIIHDINEQLKQMSKKVNFIARVAERQNNLFDKTNLIIKRTLDYAAGALAIVPMLYLIGLYMYLTNKYSVGLFRYLNTYMNIWYLLHKTTVWLVFATLVLVLVGLIIYAVKKKVKRNRVVIIAAGWLAVFFIYGKMFVGFRDTNEDDFFRNSRFDCWGYNHKYNSLGYYTNMTPSMFASMLPSLIALTDRYLKENPDNENASYTMASYCVMQRDYNKAFKLLSGKNDPERDPELSALYVKTCFLLGKYSEAWDNIEKWEKYCEDGSSNYLFLGDNYFAIKGVMLIYGLGCDADPQSGKELLRNAAHSSYAGDEFAKFHYGDVMTKVTDVSLIDNGNGFVPGIEYSLHEGIRYLREASKSLPDACILLGNLYNDLNMVDSALFYYNKPHDWILSEDMKSELAYKIGQAKNKIKDGDGDKEIEEAIERNYQPALIYAAERVKGTQRAIDYYEKRMPVYKGFRYISPLAINYLKKGNRKKALEALQKSRPNGGFNKEFIDGLAYLLGTGRIAKDSIRGMEEMRLSASKGCQYAEMLCKYRDLENYIYENNSMSYNDSVKMDIDKFMEYGDSIPFANVLLSHLYYKVGLACNATDAAFTAMKMGHPAGAYFMSHIFTYKELQKYGVNDSDLLKMNTYKYLTYLKQALRYTTDKENVLLTLALSSNLNLENDSIYENIIIANKCYEVMKVILANSNNEGKAPSINILRTFLDGVKISEDDTVTLDLLGNAFDKAKGLQNFVEYDQLLNDDKNPNSVLIKKRLNEIEGICKSSKLPINVTYTWNNILIDDKNPNNRILSRTFSIWSGRSGFYVNYTNKEFKTIKFSYEDIIGELGFIGDNYIPVKPIIRYDYI